MKSLFIIFGDRIKKKITLLLMVLFLLSPTCFGQITGAHGAKSGTKTVCGTGAINTYPGNVTLVSGLCTLTGINGYVPHSGNYKVRLYLMSPAYTSYGYADSTPAYFDQTLPMNVQDVQVSGSSVSTNSASGLTCFVLVDEAGSIYAIDWSGAPKGSCVAHLPYPPMPPDPVPLPVSCTLNNGNTLNVRLGILERSALPTTPDSSAPTIDIPVDCEGGVDVAVSMQLSYTPISVNGSQVVDTLVNGVGVAILYDGKALAPTDITHVDLASGSNTLKMGFEAVRDPSVNIGDIPTGEFHASAVLVLTQL